MKRFKKIIKTFKSKMINCIKNIKTRLKKAKKWKIYIYLNNQCVKRIKVNETFKPMEEFYIITIYGKKHILGTNKAKVVLRYDKLKYTDNDKKSTHIETKLFEGVDIV